MDKFEIATDIENLTDSDMQGVDELITELVDQLPEPLHRYHRGAQEIKSQLAGIKLLADELDGTEDVDDHNDLMAELIDAINRIADLTRKY